MLYASDYISPCGKLLIVVDNFSLKGVWFYNQKYFKANIDDELIFKDNKISIQTKNWLNRYFNNEKPIVDINLKPNGTHFQKEVWKLLSKIPYGQVTSYADIANKIAKLHSINKMSAQAIGNAVSKNPISIIIPCHRVIGSNNKLVGYAAGLEIKKKLLDFERDGYI